MATETKQDMVLRYARLVVEDVENLRTAYGSQAEAVEALVEQRASLRTELEGSRQEVLRLTKELARLQSDYEVILKGGGTIMYVRLGDKLKELEKQAEHFEYRAVKAEKELAEAKKAEEDRYQQCLGSMETIRSREAELYSERKLNSELRQQLADATKSSDSHYAKATRLEWELSGVKEDLEYSRQKSFQLVDVRDGLIQSVYDKEKRIEELEKVCPKPWQCIINKSDADLMLKLKQSDGQLRDRVSELTSLLANKDQVIEGLKANLDESKPCGECQCQIKDLQNQLRGARDILSKISGTTIRFDKLGGVCLESF